jgi:TolB-like protein/DNA-binding winged helix-turn-helix (wHTH) protein/Flp pilus assembly protein TadD
MKNSEASIMNDLEGRFFVSSLLPRRKISGFITGQKKSIPYILGSLYLPRRPMLDDMYHFGEFALDPRRRTLLRGDSPVSLTPKAFDVLLFLLQNPNRLVRKEELLRAVWGDTFVEDGNLTQYISHLRKALGDNPENARWIVTIARKGYQFAGEVVFSQAYPATPCEGQVPGTERPRTDAAPTSGSLGIEAVPGTPKSSTPKSWPKGIVAALAIFLLALAGYMSWRRYQPTTPPKTGKVMLAVLPFQNLTGDPGKEYLADGLTEETISQLGRLNPEQLGVIARTSVMGYKHKDERLDQIGRDLSVQYVLEDSLRESGDHIRLTAQLIQVKDQTHLWSQDYDYPAKDILNVEDDVAKAVTREIRVRLTSNRQAELAQSHPVNPEALDAYMQGYYFFQRNTSKDAVLAAKYYERATQLDPSYALAWVGLSRVRNWQVNIDLLPAEEGHRLAREAVERALALNPNLAEAHTQMGRIKEQADFDWAGADASFRRAVVLEPGNPEFVRLAASSTAYLGRFDEALQLDRRAVDLDPLNAYSWDALAETNFYMGQLDEAAADSKKALKLSPDVWPGPILLSRIYLMQGRPQDALPEIELVRFDAARTWLYAMAYHALGREKKSDAALSELIAKYQEPGFVADVYACRNQSDQAFEWLDRAYAQRDSSLMYTKVDPLLKNLHSDPRFAALLKKLNMPA